MGLADFAGGIVRDAGALALEFLASKDSLTIEHKCKLDLVTRADREVEQVLSNAIKQRYPDDAIFGEESGQGDGQAGKAAQRGGQWP